MSLRQDRDRREAAREAAIERAKDRLRLAQQVLTGFVEEKNASETARGITMPSGKRMSRVTAWRFRVWLGLEETPVRRRDTRAVLVEVRP